MDNREQYMYFKIALSGEQVVLAQANVCTLHTFELQPSEVGGPIHRVLRQRELILQDLMRCEPNEHYCASMFWRAGVGDKSRFWRIFLEIRAGEIECSGIPCSEEETVSRLAACEMVDLRILQTADCSALLLLPKEEGTRPYYYHSVLSSRNLLLRAAIRRMAVQQNMRSPELCVSEGVSLSWSDVIAYRHQIYYLKVFMIPMSCLQSGALLMVCHPVSRKDCLSSLCSYDSKPLPNAVAKNYGLTKREHEALDYAANGFPNRYIANVMCISEGTVKKTLSNAYHKVNVTSRIELIQRMGIKNDKQNGIYFTPREG